MFYTHLSVLMPIIYYKYTVVNNMASYADAAKQHTIFRDCRDQLSGVKPIQLWSSRDLFLSTKVDESSSSRSSLLSRYIPHRPRTRCRPIILLTLICCPTALQIIKALEDHNCDIVKFCRERLRIDNYLTNCQTGDLLIKKMYM
jgi:hypothetical protein